MPLWGTARAEERASPEPQYPAWKQIMTTANVSVHKDFVIGFWWMLLHSAEEEKLVRDVQARLVERIQALREGLDK